MKIRLISFLTIVIILGIFFCYHFYSFELTELYYRSFKKSGVVVENDNTVSPNGLVLTYEKGVVIEKSNYHNGVKQGSSEKFYDSGQLKNKMFFANGLAEGVEFEYYENGKLNYKANILHGKRYGSLYWYSTDGQFDSYAAFDATGESFCLIQYDQKGRDTSFEGRLVSSVIYVVNKKTDSLITLNLSKRYHDLKDVFITVANPPNKHLNFSVLINDKPYPSVRVDSNTVKIVNAFPNAATYNLSVVTYLHDQSGKLIKGIYMERLVTKY